MVWFGAGGEDGPGTVIAMLKPRRFEFVFTVDPGSSEICSGEECEVGAGDLTALKVRRCFTFKGMVDREVLETMVGVVGDIAEVCEGRRLTVADRGVAAEECRCCRSGRWRGSG